MDVTVNQKDLLAERFEESRGQLRAVAYRLLGSTNEADDAVQEAWLRLSRTDTSDIENLGGWLKTVVARVCLDMLRSRKSRREEPLGAQAITLEGGPEQEMLLADSIGVALLVVLEALTPGERVAFVLHDMFDVPFEDIAHIVGRSEMATRQLASRARRRVQGASHAESDNSRQRQVVDAFLAASRGGNFEALLTILDPEVIVRADQTAVAMGATAEVRGAAEVIKTFLGRAKGARLALVDGVAGLVWPKPSGEPRVVFSFTVEGDKVVSIDLIADSETIDETDVVQLEV